MRGEIKKKQENKGWCEGGNKEEIRLFIRERATHFLYLFRRVRSKDRIFRLSHYVDRILEGDSEIESVGRVEMSETRKSAAIFIGDAQLKNGLDLLC